MSEQATEKETEVVAGVIGGITLKKEGTWTVAVMPEGSEYAKNLWTKDAELVESLSQKMGQQGSFDCTASHWTNKDGKPVRSLWIASVGEAGVGAPPNNDSGTAAPPRASSPAPTASGNDGGMTPEKWDAKERRDYRSRAWAQTLSTFKHTISVADREDPEKLREIFGQLQVFQRLVFQDVCQSFAFPDDESDIPFSEGATEHG